MIYLRTLMYPRWHCISISAEMGVWWGFLRCVWVRLLWDRAFERRRGEIGAVKMTDNVRPRARFVPMPTCPLI